MLKDHTTVLAIIFGLNTAYPLVRNFVDAGFSAIQREVGRIDDILESPEWKDNARVVALAGQIVDQASRGSLSIIRVRNWAAGIMVGFAFLSAGLIFYQANWPGAALPEMGLLVGEGLALAIVPAAYLFVKRQSPGVLNIVRPLIRDLDKLMAPAMRPVQNPKQSGESEVQG